MVRHSKRASAPSPQEASSVAQPGHAPVVHPVPPLSFPSMFGPGVWCPPFPPQQFVTSTINSSLAANNLDTTIEGRGLGSRPPGGFLNLLNSTPEDVNFGSASQPINVSCNDHDDDYARTEKRLTWTKEEDLRLVSAWLNNSNDPIQANYKKNDQYWKGVTDVFNSTTPNDQYCCSGGMALDAFLVLWLQK